MCWHRFPHKVANNLIPFILMTSIGSYWSFGWLALLPVHGAQPWHIPLLPESACSRQQTQMCRTKGHLLPRGKVWLALYRLQSSAKLQQRALTTLFGVSSGTYRQEHNLQRQAELSRETPLPDESCVRKLRLAVLKTQCNALSHCYLGCREIFNTG